MRSGMSTIQQTLTPEAATALNRSVADAARRNHGQTTPLHVAATLLAAPSGVLRQACIRSHPTSSHPLQCRALELCFSVALERLPAVVNPANSTNPSATVSEPPISNALMAALKRAQAHQRRGCPEQQQQPLLAVKVELEQLIVSILDDPSVSRVMREASFSSPAVKAAIEQSISIAASNSPTTSSSSSATVGLAARNLYMNPRLHQPTVAGDGGSRKDEATRVLDIMARSKKRNPVLVADAGSASVMREVLQRIEAGDAPAPLRGVQVIPLEKEFTATSQIPTKIKELDSSIDARIRDRDGGVILDLGDLKWLVESPGIAPMIQQQIVSEMGRAAVAEMTKLLQRFGDGSGGSKVWLVGTASCATFLRCQVYHPTMENDWDLQAVSISPKSSVPNLFSRLGGNGILSSSVESLAPIKGFRALSTTTTATPSVESPATNPIKGFPALGTGVTPLRPPPENTDASSRGTLCPACMENYERELATLVAKEFDKSASNSKPEARQALPHWLQLANPVNTTKSEIDRRLCKEQELMWKQSTEELLKRWRDTCSRLHPTPNSVLPGRERPPSLPFLLYNSSILPPRTSFQAKLTLSKSTDQMSSHQNGLLHSLQRRPNTPLVTPVTTDLVLGHPKALDATLEKAHRERVKNFSGCMQDGFTGKQRDKIAGFPDYDSFKRLFKGLTEKVGWQTEAASTVATVVMQCKSGNGKLRGAGPKGDTWLLFTGPDKVGKQKMAAALSELVFGIGPVKINLAGDDNGGDAGHTNFRGRTSIDKVSDAVCRNPFSVVVLDGIDRADMLLRDSIKRAIERGRLVDSQGREVGLGSAIFILTADWLPDELKSSYESIMHSEERILNSATCAWQLELSLGDKTGKRGAESEFDDDRPPTKLRKELNSGAAISLDLNLAAGVVDDTGEGSRNSSGLTVELEQDNVRLAINCPAVSPASELMESVDNAVIFKPVDFTPLKRKVLESISAKFTSVMGNGRLIRVDEDAMDCMVAGVWLDGAGDIARLEEWADRVLVPSMKQLKSNLKMGDGGATVRLSAVKGGRRQWAGSNCLPARVAIAVDGRRRLDGQFRQS